MAQTRRTRSSIPYPVQAYVFFRDGWLCHVCRRPTIFPLAMKFAARMVEAALPGVPLAWWNPQWRRDAAPLLDELATSIDHVEAHSLGGSNDPGNLATICARCNARKSAKVHTAFVAELNPWQVKGKHGEPRHWDGLSSLYVALAGQLPAILTASERKWLVALGGHLSPLERRVAERGAL